jgi:hypothetical protein
MLVVLPCLQRVIWGIDIEYRRLKPAETEKTIIVFHSLSPAEAYHLTILIPD